MESKPQTRLGVGLAAVILSLLISPATTFGATADLQAQFEAARQDIDANRLRSARQKLSTLVEANPSLSRARLELARVYYLQRDYTKARAEAQRVLDDPNTPTSVRTTLLAFLAQIDADEAQLGERHTFTPSLYLGLMHDTNVNLGPTRDVIDVGGTPFTVPDNSQETSDTAAVFSTGIAHTYNPAKRFDWGEDTGWFLWQSQLSGYHRRYFDEDKFNLSLLTGRTGPAWIVPGHWRAGIGLQGDQIWLGSDQLGFFTTVNPNLAIEVSENWEVAFDAAYTNRSYSDSENNGREGDWLQGSVAVTRFFNDRKGSVQLGVGYIDFSADDDQFSHSGPEAFAGVAFEAWTNGTVFARASYRQYDFDGIADGFTAARDEDEWRGVLGFQHDFTEGWLDRWSLQGSWIYTQNDSNLDLFEYDRQQFNLGLARRFR